MKQKENCDVILKRIEANTTKMLTELEASCAEEEGEHREYMQQQQEYCKEQQDFCKEQQAYHAEQEREHREYMQQQQQSYTNLLNKMQAMSPPTAYHHQN